MAKKIKNVAGKTLPLVMIIVLFVFVSGMVLTNGISPNSQQVKADTATTTVNVTNAAPTWTQNAREIWESSSSTPTNAGSDVGWDAIASDSNGDDYYLLICSTSSAPTATSGGPPSCAGGSPNQWAVSSAASSTVLASTTYTTQSSDPEMNVWYAFICDGHDTTPACDASYTTGTTATNSSPFAVNHRPILGPIANDSPTDPGDTVTWSSDATTTDTDNYGGQDTVRMFICSTSTFTGGGSPQCGGGDTNTVCSSTAVTASPSCSSTLAAVAQDTTYATWAFVVDGHGFTALSGTSSDYTVANVAPTVAAASIQLLDTDGSGNLTLLPGYAGDETPGFMVVATISDNNSCEAYGGGSEISTSSLIYVYRSGDVGWGNCSTTSSGDPNNCYAEVGIMELDTCSGPSDPDVNATWTFSLWFLAEPTVGTGATTSPWWNNIWLATVKAIDDDLASSTTEDADGNELDTFTSYDLTTTEIPYGSLSTGQTSDEATTTIQSLGNTGLDTNNSGVDMEHESTTSTIPIGQQHYSTTTGFAWAAGVIASSTPQELELNCAKSTATSSPATKDTYWLLLIPAAQETGVYNGTNTIEAVTSEGQDW